jgi:hypothetical protein
MKWKRFIGVSLAGMAGFCCSYFQDIGFGHNSLPVLVATMIIFCGVFPF